MSYSQAKDCSVAFPYVTARASDSRESRAKQKEEEEDAT